uniref:C1q domain-containing protein n=1 Tax=Hucho hucho TaxID=62062 RepID=A0A4W5RVT9_9TELE
FDFSYLFCEFNCTAFLFPTRKVVIIDRSLSPLSVRWDMINKLEELKRENTAMEARVSANEKELEEELKRENTDNMFSAGLTDSGTRVITNITNIGSAYNPITAIVGLFHVDQKVVYNYVRTDHRGKYVSKALSLELHHWDVVYIRLPSGKGLYDSTNNYNTFSGFLVT